MDESNHTSPPAADVHRAIAVLKPELAWAEDAGTFGEKVMVRVDELTTLAGLLPGGTPEHAEIDAAVQASCDRGSSHAIIATTTLRTVITNATAHLGK